MSQSQSTQAQSVRFALFPSAVAGDLQLLAGLYIAFGGNTIPGHQILLGYLETAGDTPQGIAFPDHVLGGHAGRHAYRPGREGRLRRYITRQDEGTTRPDIVIAQAIECHEPETDVP